MSTTSNEVNITITAKDLTGPAFTGAMLNMAKMKAEAKALGSEFKNISSGVNVSSTGISTAASSLDDLAHSEMRAGLNSIMLKRAIDNGNASFAIMDGSAMRAGLAVKNLANMGDDLHKLDTALKDTYKINVALAEADRVLAAGTKLQTGLFAQEASSARLATAANDELIGTPGSSGGGGRGVLGLGGAAGWGWGWFRRLNVQIPLFGGALGALPLVSTIGGFHLLGESIFEAAAVLIPATMSFIAFGTAAIGSVQDITRSMTALWHTTHALNQNIYPLTGSMFKLEEAVQPAVWNLFGDMLTIVTAKTAVYNKLAKESASVVQQLGARITVALTSGGLDEFMRHAAQDLAGVGNIIGNIFGIIGNVLHAVPGYAEVLMASLEGLTHGLETVTGSPIGQWILKLSLAFHGAVIWMGLGATAAVGLGNALLGLGAKLGLVDAGLLAFNAAAFGAGIKQMMSGVLLLGGELLGLGAAEDIAAAGAVTMEGAFAAAGAVNPLVWVGAAAVALGFFVYELTKTTTSLNSYSEAANKSLQNSPISQLGINLTRQMVVAQTALNNTRQTAIVQGPRMGAIVTQTTEAYKEQRNEIGVLKGYWSNYSTVLKAAGGNVSLLNDAGITSKDILTADAQKLKELTIEAMAAANAQRALALGTGRAAAAQNAQTNIFMQETVPAMQKVISSEDNLLNVILGGQQTFNQFQQSISGTTAKFKSPSGLAEAMKLAKGNLTGLNEQSLAYSNTLYSISIPALQKTTDALQLQGISTKDLTKVVATGSGEILKYVGHNKEARSVMVDYINNALGPGTVSLQNVDKWVGKNSTSLAGMNSIVAKNAISAGNFTNVLKGMTNQMFQQDLLLSNHVNRDMRRWTDLIASSSENTNRGRSARQQLIRDLENSGFSARDATNYVNGLQRKINAMHGKTVNVGVHGAGSGKITFAEQNIKNAQTGYLEFHAAGGKIGKIPGFGGGDKHLSLLESGEAVVDKYRTQKYAYLLKAMGIPGMASGGLVGGLGTSVPYESTHEISFMKRAEASAIASMQADLIARVKAAAIDSIGNYHPGAGVQQWRGVVSSALSQAGSSQQLVDAVLYQMQTESGGNPTIVNKWDSNWFAGHPSVGLMQVIRGTFQAFAGKYRATGPFAYGVSENPMANVYSAIKYAQWNYGPGLRNAYGGIGTGRGYDKGGWLEPGWNPPMYNGTGRREHLVPDHGRAGSRDTYNFYFPNYVGDKNDLVRAIDDLRRTGRLPKAAI